MIRAGRINGLVRFERRKIKKGNLGQPVDEWYSLCTTGAEIISRVVSDSIKSGAENSSSDYGFKVMYRPILKNLSSLDRCVDLRNNQCCDIKRVTNVGGLNRALIVEVSVT